MSKFTDAAATSHMLSVAGMEEASRFGERTADIDHLLLALTVNEQTAGQVLRSLGITLASAREAVAAQHAEQLASLGITTDAPAPDRITFHESGEYAWSKRALAIFKQAGEGDKRGDASAVLRELVVEPSGMIEALLNRLGTSPDDVLSSLTEVERYPGRPTHTFAPGTLSGVLESFAPAPVDEVWALLADPHRMPAWEPGVGSVEDVPATVAVGATWTTHALTERPDGKQVRVKPEYRSARTELVACEEPRLVQWRFMWPDAPNTNGRLLRIELEPAAGGTQLHLSLAWERDPARTRRAIPGLRLLVRPLHRFLIWLHLSQLGAGISRAFR
ncbi:SRPBCC family protein [Salana multivorans]